jgi:hypothetical protein
MTVTATFSRRIAAPLLDRNFNDCRHLPLTVRERRQKIWCQSGALPVNVRMMTHEPETALSRDPGTPRKPAPRRQNCFS